MKIVLRLLIGVGCLVLLGFGLLFLLSERELAQVPSVKPFDHPVNQTEASIENGRYVARTRGCFGCHGQSLEGRDFGQQWDWPERAVAPNLAAYAQNHDVATIERAVRHGIGANGKALISMPSYNFIHLTDNDLADLIAFLRSAPVVGKQLPAPALGWRARYDLVTEAEPTMASLAQIVPPLTLGPLDDSILARGNYLAMTMCNECHGFDLRGDTRYEPGTPDLAIVASYPLADFQRLIETGVSRDGRKLGLMLLVAPDRFATLKTEDSQALYLYLSSLVESPAPEDVYWRPE